MTTQDELPTVESLFALEGVALKLYIHLVDLQRSGKAYYIRRESLATKLRRSISTTSRAMTALKKAKLVTRIRKNCYVMHDVLGDII